MAGFDDLDDAVGESDESDGSDGTEGPDGAVGRNSQTDESDDSDRPVGETEESGGFDPSNLPYKYRRETVKDDRTRVDLFVLDTKGETVDMETDVVREVEDRLDGGVSLIDAREAIYRAGMKNLGDVLAELEGWGYERDE